VNSHLGVKETLDLLDKLKGNIHDFTVREGMLSTESRIQSSAETKAYETATWQVSTRLSEDMANADTVFQTEKDRSQLPYETRKGRIRQAHRTSRKQALERIDQEEGRRKYQLQKSAMEAEHRRETHLANAATRSEEFRRKLGESREAFSLLETAAQKAFRGYGTFRRLLAPNRPWPEPDLPQDEHQILDELLKLQAQNREELDRFQRMLLPRLMGYLSIWLLIVLLLLGHAAFVPLLQHFGVNGISYREAGVSQVLLMVILFLVYYYGRRQAGPAALTIATQLAQARRFHDACLEKAQMHYLQEQAHIQNELESTQRTLDQQWQETVREAAEMRELRPKQMDEKALRISQKHEQLHHANIAQLEQQRADTIARLRQQAEAQQTQLALDHQANLAKIRADYEAQRQTLETEWKSVNQPIWEAIQTANATAAELFPEWQQPCWDHWRPPQEFKNVAKFARMEVELDKFTETTPENRPLALPCPTAFTVPLLLTYPHQGSLLFETTQTGSEDVIQAINNIIFRLLSTTPPGKLSFTIIDPVGLGQSFAGLMHLADYAESHINSRIWTQTQQIEEKLAELNEHMEKVIQMYLRNEYATIAEYNAQAGTIAEKYHILVIAGFPVNFSETAARRLLNIAASGARCGVYTLIHWDHQHALPHDFVPNELRKNSICIVGIDSGFALAGRRIPGIQLVLDAPPSPDFATRFLHKVGQSSKDSNRVEVPFSQVAPAEAEFWTEDTTEELQVPIGRSGATKLQYLAIGKGTRQHAIIAGKTGSGKSTLFHVIITNLALWCSPAQVEFYLVDFKKGVEFKCYATRRLPHARVVAIESDREFGLSVLQRVDEELRRRGDRFRKLGVQDLAGYKKAGGIEPVPRCLLIIDEFQEFFVEEDRIAQNAAVLLDRIVRQGRAFGIHVLLGSQTLGGAYTLARATLGQMVIRIALQCNEADAYLIMDENNAAPRLLTRPGEGIYNDAAGILEGNSPFQTVWLPDEVRDVCLAKIRDRANHSVLADRGPMVFEGNAPADIRENMLLRAMLTGPPGPPSASARVWLGAPNSIKGPTEAVFRPQSGNHLLIVGQREEAALAILSIALVSLAAQYPPETVRLILLDSSPPGSPQRKFLDRVIHAIPCAIQRPKPSDLVEILSGLADEQTRRTSEDQAALAPPTFFLIHGLQHHKKLRQEDDFSFSTSDSESGANAGALFVNLISDGPSRRIHVLATCDTYNNVVRFLGRKTLSEIAMRVLFQMSASDSANLIEAPDASTLGLHRALFYHDQEGYLETFRPYALPGNEWLEEVTRNLARNRPSPA
jgi:hypothetical protein